jgi:hypothetical protein
VRHPNPTPFPLRRRRPTTSPHAGAPPTPPFRRVATVIAVIGVVAPILLTATPPGSMGGVLTTEAASASTTLVPANGDGFWFSGGVTASRPNRVVRMDPSTPAAVRGLVADVVAQINAASGLAVRIGPDTTASPAADEIVVRVPEQTICGPAAAGCAANAVASTDGHGVVVHALVEMKRDLLGSGYELPVLLHEFGHAIGLGHYDAPYGGVMQLMWNSVTPDMTTYRAGDRNGLAALGAPLTNRRVVGNLDAVIRVPGGLRVRGWTLDLDTPDQTLEASVIVGGVRTAVAADTLRPDVATVYPSATSNHGIDATVAIPATTGPVTVCLDAVGHRGVQVRVACRTIELRKAPTGTIDVAHQVGPGTVRVRGWALDPDTAASIGFEVWIDGRSVTTGRADQTRRDVGTAFPGYGDRHGVDVTLAGVAPGLRRVCLWGIDDAGGPNGRAGCTNVAVRSGDPWGAVDALRIVDGRLTLAGWALDPDTTAPIRVHLWERAPWTGGRFVSSVVADSTRRDVGVAHPGYGDRHGFLAPLDAFGSGTHEVCAFAINAGPGSTNTWLGCRTVTLR